MSPARRGRARATTSAWWETYFDGHYLAEYEPLFTVERDRREVGRLRDLLGELPSGSRILDCPCGQGRHAHLLAESGFDVTGVDYSADLLERAIARGTGPHLRFAKRDMRKLDARWTGKFDAVVNLFTSFGFFDDPKDDDVVMGEFARVLAPGGLLVWHGGSRDGVMSKFLDRDWWVTANGTMVGHERSFDPLSGILSVRATWRGKRESGERAYRIRLYTASRIAELCAAHGLVVEQSFESFTEKPLGRRSSEMLLVARKEP